MLRAVFLPLALLFSGSHQQCFSDYDVIPRIDNEILNSWVESGHRFSVSLFKYLGSERLNPNLIFSPWSIRGALLLAYFGAVQETEESLAEVLQIPYNQEKPLTWSFYNRQRALNFGNSLTSTSLKSANKIFFSSQLSLRSCIEDLFENELEFINYETNVTWAQYYINNWISDRTDGQITDLIQGLSPHTTATLVNAVFYKSKWLTQFDPNYTEYILFEVKPKKWKSVNMMVRSDIFEQGYSEVLGARLLLLPYADNRTSMIILLPDRRLDPMIETLNSESLGYISDRSNYQSLYVRLAIPKYKHKSRLDLSAVLDKFGVGDALTEAADYSGFTGRKEVFLGEMVHEASIQVDEEGTTATAATAILGRSMRKPIHFVCDHPFAYIIYDFALSQVLFMGTFREPLQIQESNN